MSRAVIGFVCMVFWVAPGLFVRAQDGVNLPAELYVLLNTGRIERYGPGASGVEMVTPEEQFVVDFQVAPDGNWLAYRTDDGLYLTDMYDLDQRRQIEGETASVPGIRGRGETIAWSRSGDAIAYTTLTGGRVYFRNTRVFASLETPDLLNLVWSPDGTYLAAEATGDIWWIFRRDSNTMVLTSAIPSSRGIAWLDRDRLVFAPAEGGLIIMDLSIGNVQTPIFDAFQQYYLPYGMPDGTIRVFASLPDSETVSLLAVTPAGTGYSAREIGGGVRLLDNLHWAPGGNWLVAYEGGVLALVNAQTGEGFTLPVAPSSAYGWGPLYANRVQGVTMSRDAYFIAPDNRGVAQVWRLPSDGSSPLILTGAEFDVTEYAVSPDGRQIAYVSNSSLWITALDTETDALELTMLNVSEAVHPVFDTTGSQVYYYNTDDDGSGIWQVALTGDAPTLFVPDTDDITYSHPQPASSVSAMLLRTQSGDETGLAVVDTNTGEVRPVGPYESGIWLDGSRILVQGILASGEAGLPGLHLIDINTLETETPFTVFVSSTGISVLDVDDHTGQTIRILVRQGEPGSVQILELPENGDVPQLLGTVGYITMPRLSPDGAGVIGLTHPGGAVIIYDLIAAERFILDKNQVQQPGW